MAFLDPTEVENLKSQTVTDLGVLGKVFNSKKKEYHQKNVDHNRVEEYKKTGWEEHGKPLKTKTVMRRLKSHDEKFEDDIWCQFYKLGFRQFVLNRQFVLPFGKQPEQKKQIDVLAINDDSIFVIECKSSLKNKKAPSFKTEFEALRQRIDGHKKVLWQLYGREKKIQYVFATRNLRINRDSSDIKRLQEAGGYFFDDNIYDYVDRLLETYKSTARYQFFGLIFKGQKINENKISVPALEGKMGKQTYYMFSLEPEKLLKLGFILHRTSANKSEMPTYQRLLVPNRLKGINNFLENGGFFPNSIIVNFNETKRQKIHFNPHSKTDNNVSRSGTLEIPNSYAIAYIIDGQHRVYGYADSRFKDTNTIPVVAFKGLDSEKQLKMFMDINQNQKQVSSNLRQTLAEDLYWNDPIPQKRLIALNSAITSLLSTDSNSPLYNKISLGEDRKLLPINNFTKAIANGGLLPKARGHKYLSEGKNLSLYDINNSDHASEMRAAQQRVYEIIADSYQLAEDELNNYLEIFRTFILVNRATFAFVSLIGSLSEFCSGKSNDWIALSAEERFDEVSPYLRAFFDGLKNINEETKAMLQGKYGSGAEELWLRNFQLLVNSKFSEFHPKALVLWKERQSEEIQDQGRQYVEEIEEHLKSVVIGNMTRTFGDNWIYKIGNIKEECEVRKNKLAREEFDNFGKATPRDWTEMFQITDYKYIIETHWTATSDDAPEFQPFEDHFAIDIGSDFKTKSQKLFWLTKFNMVKREVGNKGSKEKGITQADVDFLENVCNQLKPA